MGNMKMNPLGIFNKYLHSLLDSNTELEVVIEIY